MSRDNLRSKQAIILHSCFNENERYDLVIIPHKTNKRIYQIKTTNTKKTETAKHKQIIKKRFSKRRNAVSESDTNTIQELQDLKDSMNKNNPIEKQKNF